MSKHSPTANPHHETQAAPGNGLSLVLVMLQQLFQCVTEINAKLEGTHKSHHTVDEVARMTGRAPYTVRAWVKAGHIRAERVTGTGPKGRLLIPREELAKLISQGKGAGVPAAVVDVDQR